MAIYHLEAKVVSRGAGRSAVAAAAYMSCSEIYNDYDGILHDYTKKQGLVWEQVFLPEYAPEEWADRSILWNAVEESEKTKDSRLAREFVAALPVELDKEQWKKLLTVRPFDEHGKWQYKTEKEYLCVKEGEEKPLTAAEFKATQSDGWEKQYQYKVGKKKIYMTPSTAEVQGYERISKYPKSTKYGRQNPISERWNSEEQLFLWREAWADVSNCYLELSGLGERIDHRSHAARGLDEQPTIHEGVEAGILEQKGIVSDRRELNRQIKADNKLLRELKAAVAALSRKVLATIPEIAAKLETLRDSLIISHYRFSYNKMQLAGIKDFHKKYKPLLSELKEIRKKVKEKSAEQKALSDEKDKCSVWEVGKQLQISRYLTTLTENIEELKSRRTQIFAALECKEDSEVKALEKKADSLVDIRAKLKEQQKTLQNQKQETLSEYTETLNAIAQEDLPEVAKERNHIRYGGRTELIQKLRGIYGDKFIRRQYDISEKAVDEILLIGEIPRVRNSISEQLKQPKQEVQNREQPTKMKRRDDWER